MKIEHLSLIFSCLALTIASFSYFSEKKPAADLNSPQKSQITNSYRRDDSDFQLELIEERLAQLESQYIQNPPGHNPASIDPQISESNNFVPFGFHIAFEDQERLKSDPEFATQYFEQLNEKIQDLYASDSEKLDAIEALMFSKMMMNNGIIDYDDSTSMALDIAQNTLKSKDKVKAWEILTAMGRMSESEQLKQPLLDLALNDDNPYLRGLAVQGLSGQLFSPGLISPTDLARPNEVVETLRSISTNDPDTGVRSQAQNLLNDFDQMLYNFEKIPDIRANDSESQ